MPAAASHRGPRQTSDAGHATSCMSLPRAFHETPALPQVLDLIRDVVVFGVPADDRSKIGLQGFSRPIAEGRAVPDRVAVALGAQVDLPLARQVRRPDDLSRLFRLAMRPVIIDVGAPRPVAAFTRDSQLQIVVAVLVKASRHVVHPGVMALEALRCRRSREIPRSVRVEKRLPPFAPRMEPGNRQFKQFVVAPGEIYLVRRAPSAVDEVDAGHCPLVSRRRFSDHRYAGAAAGASRFEA